MSLYERHRDTEYGLIKFRVCTIGLKAVVLPKLKQTGPNNKNRLDLMICKYMHIIVSYLYSSDNPWLFLWDGWVVIVIRICVFNLTFYLQELQVITLSRETSWELNWTQQILGYSNMPQ